jgi:carbon-monoxide dehydrogenase medium subunit
MLPDFALIRPTSLEHALGVIDEEHLPLCGGTELLLVMKMGLLFPTALVDLTGLPDLQRLDRNGGDLVIGGCVTHRTLSSDPLVRTAVPLLAEVEGFVGNPRVRAQGSIGGNLCFAEPKSDVATVLIALDARVTLVGPDGPRTVAMDRFVEGPYATVRDDRELLTEIRVPLGTPPRGRYVRLQTMERPTVGVAAVATDDRVRVVVGAVGRMPVHADFGTVSSVDVDRLMGLVEPLEDLTGAVDYKRHVTEVYVRKALAGLS